MRAVLISTAIPDYSLAFAQSVAEEAEVLMFAPTRFFDNASPLPRNGSLALQALEWPRHRHLANVTFIPRLARMVRQLEPDVVHVLSEGNLWLNALIPLLRRYPIITTVHDIEFHPGDHMSRRVPRWSIDLFIRQSDGIIVHGRALRAKACSELPVEADRIFILPHLPLWKYADIAARLKLRRAPTGDVFNILFFGRIQAYKGLRYLLLAAPQIAAAVPTARIIIAGQGEPVATATTPLPPGVTFDVRNRFIPDDEAAALFAAADLLVLPYTEASQSGVLAIAATFALPVVASRVGELGESVGELESGLVVPPGNAEAIARAVISLAGDPERRRQLGRNALRHAEEQRREHAIGKSAVAIYRQVASSRGRRRPSAST
jgi:glycosyltransferase involved in cell wall biosynthesis